MLVNHPEPLTAWNQTTTILSRWKHKSCTLQVFLLQRERERERSLSCARNHVRTTTWVLQRRWNVLEVEVVVLCGNTEDYFLCGRKESLKNRNDFDFRKVWQRWRSQSGVNLRVEATGELQWDRNMTEHKTDQKTLMFRYKQSLQCDSGLSWWHSGLSLVLVVRAPAHSFCPNKQISIT